MSHNAFMPYVTYLPGQSPLVLDSPHSGTDYPADFGYSCKFADLRSAEDTHVEKLYDFAPALGAAWVEAHFPRSYLDANRNTTEIDASLLDGPWPHEVEVDPVIMSKVRLGKGLIWRHTDEGVAIYDRLLRVAEIQGRIDSCWRPYHAVVQQAIDAAYARHGYSIHINCHSMPAVSAAHSTDFPGLVHADFVVGTRDDTSAGAAVGKLVCDTLRETGCSVEYNHPYKGVELVRRYGDPANNRHSVQLEINRRLYMDEQTFKPNQGFEWLKARLHLLMSTLIKTDPRRL